MPENVTNETKTKSNPITYFKGVGRELKRVRWPERKQYFVTLGVILIITVLAGLILFVEDLAGETLIEQLRAAFESLRG